MLYEAPIKIYLTDTMSKIEKELDDGVEKEVLKAVQSVGINVDKDELIKALRYDRDQYNKGYGDGYSAGYKAAARRYDPEKDDFSREEFNWDT